jgi:D-alanyl-D-alanine carboxypeptidase
VLSESAFATLTTPVLEEYAYGVWVRHDKSGHTVIQHTGGIAGFHSAVEAHMDEGFALVFLSNGGIDQELKNWVVQVTAAAFEGTPAPAVPAGKATSSQPDLGEYAGLYRAPGKHDSSSDSTSGSRSGSAADSSSIANAAATLEFVFAENRLFLKGDHGNIALEKMGTDLFRASGEATDGLPFVFSRSGADGHGKVTDVSHGALWYATEKFPEALGRAPPKNYASFIGHFVNNGPEGPVARVFVHNGRLMMLLSEDEDATAEPLEPIGSGLFRIGKANYSPERAHFDTLVDGQALRLFISGVPLYRKDTP